MGEKVARIIAGDNSDVSSRDHGSKGSEPDQIGCFEAESGKKREKIQW